MKIKRVNNKKRIQTVIAMAGLLASMSITAVGAERAAFQTGGDGFQSVEGQQQTQEMEPGMQADPQKFVLPKEARVLVVVEGTGESKCQVYTWEKVEDNWMLKFIVDGNLGFNGMSNHRVMGDKTTPIGVFQMNTPFGQDDPLEGFPANYVKVKESHVWEDETNSLVDGSQKEGERVGTSRYAGYYDYAIDAGFNKEAIPNQGSALFLHCMPEGSEYSSGCVQIPKEQMAEIMKLYGAYGDGACYIAQAPRGTFGLIYNTYGTNYGLSPDGDF